MLCGKLHIESVNSIVPRLMLARAVIRTWDKHHVFIGGRSLVRNSADSAFNSRPPNIFARCIRVLHYLCSWIQQLLVFFWALLRHSEAPVVTALWTSKFRGSIPIREKICFFSPEQSRPTLGPTQTSFNAKLGS